MQYVWGYVVFFGTNVLVGCVAYIYLPSYRHYFVTEDSLIENLSAAFFLSSCFLAFLFSIKRKNHTKAFVLISALGLLGFLDELSFGERLFGFSMPRIAGVKIDAAHDFVDLGCKIFNKIICSHTMYVYLLAGIGGIVIMAFSRYWSKLKNPISGIFRYPPYIFLLFFVVLIFSALLIDLEIMHYRGLVMLEELFEMNAAIALLFCCLSFSGSEKHEADCKRDPIS